jgi:hypothetical protein
MMADEEEPTLGKPPLEGRSSNHFELAFTQFEFLLNFGQAYERSDRPIIHTRVILTPHSAKTLSKMLTELVDQYESSVGPIQAVKR